MYCLDIYRILAPALCIIQFLSQITNFARAVNKGICTMVKDKNLYKNGNYVTDIIS